uniref:Tumor necrosis factor ligand superfamily member 10 n=1 Tax=Meleagris gallopavo TaxID=9103 RepID=G1NCC1_MELGA
MMAVLLLQLRDTYSKSGTACLTGEELGDLIQNLDVMESKDRVADPCWQVKWHLGKLIKKMMSRILQENMSAINGDRSQALPRRDEPPQGPTLRIAAHLTGSSKRSSTSPHNYLSHRGIGQKIHSWESSRRGHSFLYNVELWNGELVVPQTGFYYIYSQTYFRFRENENEDSDLLERIRNPKQLVQYIYKLTNYPDPILLMKSARTSCWSKKAEYGLYSIYQGGVFQLKKEDRIFVSRDRHRSSLLCQQEALKGHKGQCSPELLRLVASIAETFTIAETFSRALLLFLGQRNTGVSLKRQVKLQPAVSTQHRI